MSGKIYDMVIVGGGPGGLSAAIYAARGKLTTLVIEEKRRTGGQCATYSEIENYPGYLGSSAPELMDSFHTHAEKFGVEFAYTKVKKIDVSNDELVKKIQGEDGNTYLGKTVVISTGSEPRILGIPGELEYRGKGVSYCATCDADFYEELDIVVVGSGNTAVEESVYLTKFVEKITMIVIHDEGTLDADKVAQEEAFKNEKIEFVWNSVVDEIYGNGIVKGVKLKNIKTGEISDLPCSGVFMFVGTVPQTEFVKDLVELTPAGYIKVGDKQDTSVAGVFAVGDVIDKTVRQVITAAGDGAVAAVCASGYLTEEENWAEKVSQNPNKVVVLFWTPLSKDSVTLMGHLEKLCKDKGVDLVPMDVYKHRFMATKYKVTEVPSVLVFEKGEEIKRIASPTESDVKTLL